MANHCGRSVPEKFWRIAVALVVASLVDGSIGYPVGNAASQTSQHLQETNLVATAEGPPPLTTEFLEEVFPKLSLPGTEDDAYVERLIAELRAANVSATAVQFIVLVDRSPNVQAAFLHWGLLEMRWQLVGTVPVSTGLPGSFKHFKTPLGVFEHSLLNPDYRSEGTENRLGFRGYGVKGMRVFDFGWIAAPRGWGDGAMGELRLQMHATDPSKAEDKLGRPQSEGCVRIPSSFNAFLDKHAVLDEDYERMVDAGKRIWQLRKDRVPTSSPGRYLVVVETDRARRPDWSPLPASN